MKKSIKKVSRRKAPYPLQSFTYFLPAPKEARDQGYREMAFDKILSGFLAHDFELVDYKLAGVDGPKAGCFVLVILRPLSHKANKLNLEKHLDFLLSESTPHPDIELER